MGMGSGIGEWIVWGRRMVSRYSMFGKGLMGI